MQVVEIEIPDDELLLAMSYSGQDPRGAEEALRLFYRRHNADLFRFAIALCKGTSIDAEQFMLETFKEVFERAGSFNCKSKAPDLIRKMVKSWLFTMLKHRVVDEIRATRRERGYIRTLKEDESIEDQLSPESNAHDAVTANPDMIARAHRILDELSPREQAILGLSFEYKNVETGNYEIPEELLNDLANEYGVLPSSIKTLRHRIISRIQKREPQALQNQTPK